MFKHVAWVVVPLLGVFAVVIPSIGCGGGGGAPPGSECLAPLFDLSVTWEITETEPSNTCSDPIPPPETEVFTVTQVGNTVTAVGGGQTRTFQLCGDTLVVPGSQYPDDGGITTVPATTATFTSPDNWSGDGTWTWTDGATTCSGTTHIEATRL